MKRSLSAVALVVLAALALALFLRGTALAQDQRPVIAQPEQDATVRGLVQLVGTATHSQFKRYELYYAPGPAPADNAWIFIGPDAHFQQQPLGLLGTWDSRAVPDGTYSLRVRVVKTDGNYLDSELRRVVVANSKPAESPTPSVTPTSSDTPTPAATLPPPTAVTIATVPPAGRGTAAPSPTRAAAAGASATGTPAAGGSAGSTILPGSDSSSLLDSIGAVFDFGRLSDTAQWAAMMTIGAFVVVGAFFAVKALLYWLWLKIRP